MRAVVFERHGGPEVLELRDGVPDPAMRPGHVRVRVRAASVNHLDIWTRKGLPYAIEMPHILGNDIAGVVEEVDAAVTHVAVGDAVMVAPGAGCNHCRACLEGDDNLCMAYDVFGLRRQGGYAEYRRRPRAQRVPQADAPHVRGGGVDAARVPHRLAHARRARALARRRDGARARRRAAAWASRPSRSPKCSARPCSPPRRPRPSSRARKELGADAGIPYEQVDFAAEARRLTGKRGVDVVIEHTGQSTWEQSIAALARGGRLVTCGASSGYEGKTDLRVLFAKNLSLHGSYMGRLAEFDEVLCTFAPSGCHPVVDRVLPLAQARAAHEAMEKREQFGKIVLVP